MQQEQLPKECGISGNQLIAINAFCAAKQLVCTILFSVHVAKKEYWNVAPILP